LDAVHGAGEQRQEGEGNNVRRSAPAAVAGRGTGQNTRVEQGADGKLRLYQGNVLLRNQSGIRINTPFGQATVNVDANGIVTVISFTPRGGAQQNNAQGNRQTPTEQFKQALQAYISGAPLQAAGANANAPAGNNNNAIPPVAGAALPIGVGAGPLGGLGATALLTSALVSNASMTGELHAAANSFHSLGDAFNRARPADRFVFIQNVTAGNAQGAIIARDLGPVQAGPNLLQSRGSILNQINQLGVQLQNPQQMFTNLAHVQVPAGVQVLRAALVRESPNGPFVVALVGVRQVQAEGGQTEQAVMIMPSGQVRTYAVTNIPTPTFGDMLVGQGSSNYNLHIVQVRQVLPGEEMNLNQVQDHRDWSHSFAPVERPAAATARLEKNLAAFGAASLAGQFTWEREQAGAVLVNRLGGKLQATGAKLFKTISLPGNDIGRPSERQVAFAGAINDAWNKGGDVRATVAAALAAYPDVAAEIAASSDEARLNAVMSAEAFSTAAGVAVLDKAYRELPSSFVPFHTHIGHPESFLGAARYAPTAADIWAHRAVMARTATTHGSTVSMPGLIFHADGTVTTFWADSDDVAFEIIGASTVRVHASLNALGAAEVSGKLDVKSENGDLQPTTGERATFGTMPLWDRKLVGWRREEETEEKAA
ncbi:MAG: hypothetical protein JO102_00745, partial [Elusimicrobia bacterium]|nr:hypothetical protein [Elusimicrobiota bacterium]